MNHPYSPPAWPPEKRRRETKAGFATQKECEAAMNKLLASCWRQPVDYWDEIACTPSPFQRDGTVASHSRRRSRAPPPGNAAAVGVVRVDRLGGLIHEYRRIAA